MMIVEKSSFSKVMSSKLYTMEIRGKGQKKDKGHKYQRKRKIMITNLFIGLNQEHH